MIEGGVMVSKVLCNIVVDFGGWRANTPRVGDAPYAQTCCCQCQYHVANISCRLIEQVSFFFTSIPYARHYRNVTKVCKHIERQGPTILQVSPRVRYRLPAKRQKEKRREKINL